MQRKHIKLNFVNVSLKEKVLHKNANKNFTKSIKNWFDIRSTVHKEKDGDKEELKLETFTYHEEGEEEQDDPDMHVPGAKLCRLKERLQEKMKVKREEARQVGCSVVNSDNRLFLKVVVVNCGFYWCNRHSKLQELKDERDKPRQVLFTIYVKCCNWG